MTPTERRFAELIVDAQARAEKARFRVAVKAVGVATLWAGVAVIAAKIVRDQAEFSAPHLAALPFFPAIVLARRFGGQLAGFITAALCVFAEALVLFPAFPPWFIYLAVSVGLVAAFSSQGLETHPPDHGVSQDESRRLVKRRLPFFLALGQDVVK
jgi:hypothetical protein